jgi:c-di-GMP-binding flagellar brake protein YcgR
MTAFMEQLGLLDGTPLAQARGWAVLALLAWAAAFLGVLLWHVRSRRLLRARFLRMADMRDFTDAEARHLFALSRFVDGDDPCALLDSYDLFRRSVERARTAAGQDLATWPEYLHEASVIPLRAKMMSRRPARHSLARTTDLERNQVCTVHLAGDAAFETYVARVTAKDLCLALPDNTRLWEHLMPGSEITVSFWRSRDARYEFTRRVIDTALGMLFLPHGQLHRRQQRSHVRVRCHEEARLAEMTPDGNAPSGKRLRAGAITLQDISAGGAAFVCETPHRHGQPVVLQLALPVQERTLQVPARVLRETALSGTSRTLRRVAVRFEVASSALRTSLDQLMAQLQQHQIRRFRTRTGAAFVRRTSALAAATPPSGSRAEADGARMASAN